MGRPGSGQKPPSPRLLQGPLAPSEIHFRIPSARVARCLHFFSLRRKLEAQEHVEVKGHTPELRLWAPAPPNAGFP